MLPDWIEKIGDFVVERKEIPRPGNKPYRANSHTQIGVLHTTEGDTVKGAWSTLAEKGSAPHFIVGDEQIVQCRPLTAQAAALHGDGPVFANANSSVQIEIVARSQETLWLPKPGTVEALCAVLRWANGNGVDIPLQVPVAEWVDDCSDVKSPWAANNGRRKSAEASFWPSAKGWWMHMEVPGQGPTWHWDCGAIQRTKLLEIARQGLH